LQIIIIEENRCLLQAPTKKSAGNYDALLLQWIPVNLIFQGDFIAAGMLCAAIARIITFCKKANVNIRILLLGDLLFGLLLAKTVIVNERYHDDK
jgi:hypothetical protein